MTGWKSLTGRFLLGVAGAALLGALLVTAADEQAQDAQPPGAGEYCPDDRPDDQKVEVTCRLKGTLVKKWVCSTEYGQGVSDDRDDAVRRACQAVEDSDPG